MGALIDAADQAGMNTLRVISDGAAAAISYGPYRVEELLKEETFVAFCSCGHSCFTVSLAMFKRDGLQVVAESCDRRLGAREMDLALMRHFAEEFQAKNKGVGDPLKYKKSVLKLEEAVQKTKKILSSNEVGPVNTECLVEDYDFSSSVSRETFESLCEPLIQRLRELIKGCLARAQVPPEKIDNVEMIGGASRVPWVKRVCQEEFQKQTLSTTLNADEAVVRGCALQAAMYSALYKVRPYNVWLYSQRAYKVAWGPEGCSAEEEQSVEVFPLLTPLNMVKLLACYQPGNFAIRAFYSDDPNEHVGRWVVECNNPGKNKIHIHAKLDVNGLFTLEKSQLFDAEGANPTPLKFAKVELPGSTAEELQEVRETELKMLAQIEKEESLENLRNDLESLLYRQRDRVAALPDGADKEAHSQLLEETETWLYDAEDTCTEEELNTRIEGLQRGLGRIEEAGEKGAEKRKELISELKDVLLSVGKNTTTASIKSWLTEKEESQASLAEGDPPELLCYELQARLKELHQLHSSDAAVGGAAP